MANTTNMANTSARRIVISFAMMSFVFKVGSYLKDNILKTTQSFIKFREKLWAIIRTGRITPALFSVDKLRLESC